MAKITNNNMMGKEKVPDVHLYDGGTHGKDMFSLAHHKYVYVYMSYEVSVYQHVGKCVHIIS